MSLILLSPLYFIAGITIGLMIGRDSVVSSEKPIIHKGREYECRISGRQEGIDLFNQNLILQGVIKSGTGPRAENKDNK